MNYELAENTIIFILKEKESGKESTEVDVSSFNLSEAESLRYNLIQRGFRVEIYSEFKKRFLGIWF